MENYILNATQCKNGDGQPFHPFPGQFENNAAKALAQLASICTGILCDGEINDREVQFFKEWVQSHREFSTIRWFSDLQKRLDQIFVDGHIDKEEREELRSVMQHIRGGDDLAATYSSPLPLCNPQPIPIIFQDRFFTVTGKFAFGKRAKVIDMITGMGGVASDNPPSRQTNYLVIGKFVSRDWIEESYGLKILKAVELREKGVPISIVSEDHWRGFV